MAKVVDSPFLAGGPGWVSGYTYLTPFLEDSTNLLITENTIYYMPVFNPYPVAVDRVVIGVTTAAADATCQIKAAIYTNGRGHPQSLVMESAFLTISNTTGDKEAIVSGTAPAGWLWAAFICNRNGGAGAMPQLARTASNQFMDQRMLLGNKGIFSVTATGNGDSEAGTVGTWASYAFPSVANATRLETNAPIIGIRCA
jgi:hypothetical protein